MEKTKVIINGWMDTENVILHVHMIDHKASLVAQTVKNLPAMQETQVRSLGSGRSPEKGMAAHLEIKPVNPKRKSTWIFTPGRTEYSPGRTDAEAEAPILQPPDGKSSSLEKILMLGKIESKRKRRWQTMRWLDNITHPMDMNLSKLQEIVKDRDTWHATVHGGHKESDTTQQLNNSAR